MLLFFINRRDTFRGNVLKVAAVDAAAVVAAADAIATIVVSLGIFPANAPNGIDSQIGNVEDGYLAAFFILFLYFYSWYNQ